MSIFQFFLDVIKRTFSRAGAGNIMSIFEFFLEPPNIDQLYFEGNVQGLINCFEYKKDRRIGLSAVFALGEIGTPSVEPLQKALQNTNPAVKKFSTLALGLLGDYSITQELISLASGFGYDSELGNLHLNFLAVQILAQMGNSEAIMPLLQSYREMDFHREDLPPEGIQLINNIISNSNNDSLVDLVRNVLIPELEQKDISNPYYPFWQNSALVLFKTIGKPAIAPLLEVLESVHHPWQMEILAVKALGEIADARAVGPIRKWLNGSIEEVPDSGNPDHIPGAIWSNQEKKHAAKEAIRNIQNSQRST